MAERIENHLFVFAGLSPEEAKRLLQGSRLRRYTAGETVYGAGEHQTALLLLLQGAVKVWVPQPRPLILEIVLPGESFGDFCQDGQGRGAEEAEALEPSVVRAFPFARLLAGSPNGTQPTLGQRLLGLYCRRAAQARHLWCSGVSEDVPQRVARRLLELLRHVPDGPGMATVPVRLRQEDLAYLVGSTRTTVSEILNDFERRGLVELKRVCYRVDRQKIQQTLWPRRSAA